MKLPIPQLLKSHMIQFANLYHSYKTETEKLTKARYSIHSTLLEYKKTGLIQLAHNDRPGDLLPPMNIQEIKTTTDLLSGLHPVDVNSINDLYYLSKDKISEMIISDDKIRVISADGTLKEYYIDDEFECNNQISKRVSFLIGYMQAEKLMQATYRSPERYKLIRDNITTLGVLDLKTQKEIIKNPSDILFSDEYLLFSKQDICRIGYICGQMSKV